MRGRSPASPALAMGGAVAAGGPAAAEEAAAEEAPGAGPPRCRFCGLALSSAGSHRELCANLRRHGVLKSQLAFDAYEQVDRADFVPAGIADPYLDAAVVLGATGAQISAPHVHASALELLCGALAARGPGAPPPRALDVGCGSGCMCVLLARLLQGTGGSVLAVEHIEELAAAAEGSVRSHHGELLTSRGGPLELRCVDARALAARPESVGAFDLVHCGAALPEPQEWLTRMLRAGGRAVVPLGPTDAPQWLCTLDRREDGSIRVARHLRVLYVPVTSAAHQRARGACWDEVVDRCVKNSAAAGVATGEQPPASADGDDIYS